MGRYILAEVGWGWRWRSLWYGEALKATHTPCLLLNHHLDSGVLPNKHGSLTGASINAAASASGPDPNLPVPPPDHEAVDVRADAGMLRWWQNMFWWLLLLFFFFLFLLLGSAKWPNNVCSKTAGYYPKTTWTCYYFWGHDQTEKGNDIFLLFLLVFFFSFFN